MTNRVLLLASVFVMLSTPAFSGNNLFPPDNAQDGKNPCDAYHRLVWTGNSVVCKPLQLKTTCNANEYMIGIDEAGKPICVYHPFDQLASFISSCSNPSKGNAVATYVPKIENSDDNHGSRYYVDLTSKVILTATAAGYAISCGGLGNAATTESQPVTISINYAHSHSRASLF